MDTFIYSLLRVTVMILILRTLMRVFIIPRTGSFTVKRAQNETRSPQTQEQKSDKTAESIPIQWVHDETCHASIDKSDAYILVDDTDIPHYFCSWECRQQFLENR